MRSAGLYRSAEDDAQRGELGGGEVNGEAWMGDAASCEMTLLCKKLELDAVGCQIGNFASGTGSS